MEFIREFSIEVLEEVVKNALKEGYKIRLTEWLDKWEREEGCPSICYELDDDDIYTEYGDLNLPEETKHGCSEWNFVKNNEFICGYHIENGDEYICKETFELFLYPYIKECKFTSNNNPFGLIYNANIIDNNYEVTWHLDGQKLCKVYKKEDFFYNIISGKFKII